MPIPPSILERIETFRRNLDSYLQSDYKEAQVRQEFIDPFFAALGWDVRNEQGYAEAYKDVIHEDTLRLAGSGTTAPDYSFRIGGTRKFFVEAKKPAVVLKEDPEPALQLRRYSWSDKLALGIVTDFQEFAIYDTRIKPKEGDKAFVARIFYCTYEQYPEKWDEIAGIFSREAVLKGSFDKFAATNKGKRGTTAFDDDFLADMEHWRELLARNLALRNAALSQRDLNFAVQRILDRIVFLRIAEDRGIEPYGQLQALTAGGGIYPRLGGIFERADFRYNSGLFHFATERDRTESPDRLTLGLTLDDAPLKEIIRALYWPKSPYAFAVIPADILGHVYEQFLGKVIHLTPDHRARVEEKPEVRKAGGVYYTPTYIVNYIVKQTVGPLVAGKTPKQVAALKVLDPACGSGSFLLGAYDFLLDWHLRYYLEHDPAAWAKRKNPPVYETAPNARGVGLGSGNWQLTTTERKRILVANLHGVDIDAQAVEVTKLSLLLKVLEGEARELRGRQLDFHRVLPDLGQNIKCGNSLIGSDFYAQADLPAFDDEARIKINAFDWAHEFKSIMAAGGFDAVIGNPPYGAVDDEQLKGYYASRFDAVEGRFDHFELFIERAYRLVAPAGKLGYIIPTPFLTNLYSQKLRRFVAEHAAVDQIVSFKMDVFADPTVHTCIIILSRSRPGLVSIKSAITDQLQLNGSFDYAIAQRDLGNGPSFTFDVFLDPATRTLSKRLTNSCDPLSSCCFIRQCIKTGNDPEYVRLSDKRLPAPWVSTLRGRGIGRYQTAENNLYVKYGPWLARNWANRTFYERPKIAVRETGNRITATFDADQRFFLSSLYSVYPKETEERCARFFLALLNSSFANFFVKKIALDATEGAFTKIRTNQLGRLPIPKLGTNKADRAQHDALVAHVERMLKLHTDLAAAKSPDAQTHLARDIAATDRAIDALVYQLYGLTPAEIALVEQATAPAATQADAPDPAEPPAPQPPTAPKPPPPDRTPFRYLTPAELEARDIDFGVKEDPARPPPGNL